MTTNNAEGRKKILRMLDDYGKDLIRQTQTLISMGERTRSLGRKKNKSNLRKSRNP